MEEILLKLLGEILSECLSENDDDAVIESMTSQSADGRFMRRVAAGRARRQAGKRFRDLSAEERKQYHDFVMYGVSKEVAEDYVL